MATTIWNLQRTEEREVFNLKKEIRNILASGRTDGLFDLFLESFEWKFGQGWFQGGIATATELRKRENKMHKGRAFEEFSLEYLKATDKYQAVYAWKDIPDNLRETLGLKAKVDDGIDLIAVTHEGRYHAIQCKYRKKTGSTVPWTQLATFFGLCARTGPWEKHLVITNCRGITMKIQRTKKDKSICYGTFKNLSRDVWMKMVGDYVEHRLTDNPIDGIQGGIPTPILTRPETLEELRERRLKALMI